MTHFQSRICGKGIKVGDSNAGKHGKCPACGAAVHVPEGPGTAPQGPPPLKPDQRTAVLPDDPITPETRTEAPFEFDGNSDLSARVRLLPRALRSPVVLSVAALAISMCTAAWSILHDPLGAGISSYDFTTPANAPNSKLATDRNGDVRAMMDLDRLRGRRSQEKMATIKVRRDAEYGGKKILFISFKENGLTKHDTEAFEKDAETGLWFPAFVGEYSMTDAALKRAIETWKEAAE